MAKKSRPKSARHSSLAAAFGAVLFGRRNIKNHLDPAAIMVDTKDVHRTYEAILALDVLMRQGQYAVPKGSKLEKRIRRLARDLRGAVRAEKEEWDERKKAARKRRDES